MSRLISFCELIRYVCGASPRELHDVHSEVVHVGVPTLLEAKQVCDKAYNLCLEGDAHVAQALMWSEETPNKHR